jgi:uncharacterized DUF497 family protein
MARAHPGFNKASAAIAKKQGVSQKRADAILAAGARKASKKAVKKNPRLKKVGGVKKASEASVSARSREQARIVGARAARKTQ